MSKVVTIKNIILNELPQFMRNAAILKNISKIEVTHNENPEFMEESLVKYNKRYN